ncbi:MAG TPA: rod shape-determining protein MreC [Actinomycetota bacterium]
MAVSLVTITVDFREGEHGPLASVGRVAMAVISPLQSAVSKVTHPIGNFFSTLVRLPSIRDENERLKDEIAELKAQVSTGLADEARLHQLEALLGVEESLGPNVQTAAAQVIANGVSNFEWTITIGKGSRDGIAVDQPVLSPAGLVGHVVRVAPDSAVVQLAVDPDSSVAGRLDVSGKTGLVSGQGNQDMRMGLVDTSTEVQAGERVVTAGFRIPGVAQSLYPPGILIGTVSRVLPSEASLEKFITVSPAVDFSGLDLVLVVLTDGAG